jgi:hypothetical protein
MRDRNRNKRIVKLTDPTRVPRTFHQQRIEEKQVHSAISSCTCKETLRRR